MKLNQKGITLIEGLLVVIVLTLVAAVGFYVYSANKDKATNAKTTSASEATKQVETKKTAPSLDKAVAVTKEYYQFRYIDKWNEQVPKEQLNKWLTPNLIEQLSSQDGYQGGADSDHITRGGGFTIPDSIEAKGKTSDNMTATVDITFVYSDNREGSPGIVVTLVPNGDGWLIASAHKNAGTL